MFKPLIILGLSLTFVGCATTSSDSATSANNNQEKVAGKDDEKKKIICKRTHKVGTHFKTKQCWTAEEYAQEQENSRKLLENMQKSNITEQGQ